MKVPEATYVGISFVLALHIRILRRLLESRERLRNVAARELKTLVILVENQNCHITVAEDGKLLGLLQQPLLSLHERHLPLARLRDRADRDLLPLHRLARILCLALPRRPIGRGRHPPAMHSGTSVQ